MMKKKFLPSKSFFISAFYTKTKKLFPKQFVFFLFPFYLIVLPAFIRPSADNLVSPENLQRSFQETPPWTLDKTVSNVDFYHRITECDGEKVVLLKFNNRNSYKVKVSWKEDFITRQIARKTEGTFGSKQLILLPREMSEGSCTKTKCQQCLILPDQVSPAYKADIAQFEYKDISVSRI